MSQQLYLCVYTKNIKIVDLRRCVNHLSITVINKPLRLINLKEKTLHRNTQLQSFLSMLAESFLLGHTVSQDIMVGITQYYHPADYHERRSNSKDEDTNVPF